MTTGAGAGAPAEAAESGAPTGAPPEKAGPGVSVRVVLPAHLRTLAGVTGEVRLTVPCPPESLTTAAVLDAVEARYPVLVGTIRDAATGRRRPFVRFFACEEDLSHEPAGAPLPAEVAAGREPLIVLGAMAGG